MLKQTKLVIKTPTMEVRSKDLGGSVALFPGGDDPVLVVYFNECTTKRGRVGHILYTYIITPENNRVSGWICPRFSECNSSLLSKEDRAVLLLLGYVNLR